MVYLVFEVLLEDGSYFVKGTVQLMFLAVKLVRDSAIFAKGCSESAASSPCHPKLTFLTECISGYCLCLDEFSRLGTSSGVA